jgi:hypothetical protein
VNGACVWVEIEANRKGENVALNKEVTPSVAMAWGHTHVTDGLLDLNDYTWQMVYSTPAYVQIDLGQVYNDIEEIKVWHYPDGRIFIKTKTEVSEDGINWITIFDTDVSGTYAETMEGLSIAIPIHGTSLEFTRDAQSYVSIPHHDSLIINGSMCMEFWIKLKPLPNDFQVILDKGNISTSQYYVIHEARNGNNQIKYRFGNGHERTFNRPFSIIEKWVHMAFVWDGANMIFYENGELIAFETFPVTFAPNDLPLTFGRMSAGGAYLDAYLDNIRIWNVARTQQEIIDNKDIPSINNKNGLIGAWQFDEGLGMVAFDSSLNSNHGSIVNATFSVDEPFLRTPIQKALPIKLGEMNIDKLFLGEKQIEKIYLGDNLLGG